MRPTKSGFPRAQQVTYLDTAAEGLPPAECAQALEGYFRDKSMGTPGRARLYEAEAETRRSVARLLGTPPKNVALLSNASEGLNVLANSIRWSPGDEVLISDLEFPSNVVAWLRLRKQGVTVRVIQTAGGIVTCEEFVRHINARTRLISVSKVSYKTGTRIGFLGPLSREAHQVGAVLCLDATQALGRVPVPVEGVDFLVSSSYKWLLGAHGLGVVYISPELRNRLVPSSAGWYSVEDIFMPDRFQRFEFKKGAAALVAGMPNFPAIYCLRRSLDYLLDIGIERLDLALKTGVERLRTGLASLGIQLLTPPEPEYASGIVSFEHPKAVQIGEALEQRGVIVWAGDQRVRASVHLYNDETDIDRYLSVLERILTGLENARV